MQHIAPLPNRAVLSISGADRTTFLQGLISNDVTLLTKESALFAALLSPQGKYLADFFLTTDGEKIFVEGESTGLPALAFKLRRFRLRADVAIEPTDLLVFAAWGGTPLALPPEATVTPDPRLPEAGFRILSPSEIETNATPEDYNIHRLTLGLPDGAQDLLIDKTILLEAGFDELHGISWSKGCYMGQELTARTRYRGLIKKRILPVSATSDLPPPGTILRGPDGRETGEMRSSSGTIGMALLKIDQLETPISADGITITPHVPAWCVFTEASPKP